MQPSFEFNLSNCLESLPILKRPRLDDPPPLPAPVQPPPRLPPPPVVQPPPPPPASPRPEPLESPESPEPPEPPESPPTPPPGSPPEPQTAAQKLLHELINGPSAPAGAEPMATEEAPAPDPQSVTQKMLDALINGPPAAAPAPLPFLMPPAPTLRALPALPALPATTTAAPVSRRHAGLLREDGGVVAWMHQRQLEGTGAQPEVQDAHGVRLQPDAV